MIDWVATSSTLPRDGELCLIYNAGNGAVLGPVPFRSSGNGSGAWLGSALANGRAGLGEVSHWCAWRDPAAAAAD